MLYQVAQLILLRIAMINSLEVVGGLFKSIKAFFPLAIWITFSDGITLNHVYDWFVPTFNFSK